MYVLKHYIIMKHNLQNNKFTVINFTNNIYKNKTNQIAKPYYVEKVRRTTIYLERVKDNRNQLMKSV